jgi:hypothetical protein
MSSPASASPTDPPRTGWFIVALAWVLVGLPLAWGIFQTVRKASLLFK